ncbi:hypothetical protein HN031_01530 [Nocardioides sp. zg-1308]|uniref:hypothetical protein n=1 Tax=Nocardioides sp. zg-1308 TaxID=2736253 RepID=UPI001556F7B1|nr:hypothetical protein [Nocardioides sp. zg-1308]NPD03364.1 hypothetical protein [Nocardioides sp. zg-1308]
MKVVAMSARIVASAVGALVVVPVTVLLLLEGEVAGSWTWLPLCVVLVAGLSGCIATGLWWPHRRMRVLAGVVAFAWATVALSVAFWPMVATRAEVRAAFDRVDYGGGIGDPTIFELGPAWCAPGFTSVLGCPRMSVDYLVDEGGGADVLRALEEAGFDRVGEPRQREIEGFDFPGSRSAALGTRHWLVGDGVRVEVTILSEREHAGPVPGPDNATMFVPTSTERVSLELSDAENSARLEIPDDLGFWSPHAPLDELQPPAGW